MSTMHRPKLVSPTAGPQTSPWSSARAGAKPQRTQTTWTLTWSIAAPASARGEMVWTIDAADPGRVMVRCELVQAGETREVVAWRQASLVVAGGLTHVIAEGDHDGAALLTVTIDHAAGVLLYASTSALGTLGVLGGRAEPPVMAEIAPAVVTRSAGR